MKILISSVSFGKVSKEPVEILKNAGFEPVLNTYGRKFELNEFIELIHDAVGLIAGTEKIGAELLKNASKLKVISRYGVGVDNINLEVAENMGIIVRSATKTHSQSVAELTLALMLNLYRRIGEADRSIRNNMWSQCMGRLLFKKTLGIIGFGKIGKRLANLVSPFGMKIYAYDLSPDLNYASLNDVNYLSLNKLLEQSDIISLHLPLLDETHPIIGEKELLLMKKDAIIINTARGGLIDEQALFDVLGKKMIGGAAIDVFEEEPYRGKLTDLNNIVLTCHMGTATLETRNLMELETVSNLIAALKEGGV